MGTEIYKQKNEVWNIHWSIHQIIFNIIFTNITGVNVQRNIVMD